MTSILFVGDVVGGLGRRTLLALLPGLREELGGGAAVRRQALVVLGDLLGEVHVQGPAAAGLDDRGRLVVGDCSHRVEGGTDPETSTKMVRTELLKPEIM